jgi:hypothetical protein
LKEKTLEIYKLSAKFNDKNFDFDVDCDYLSIDKPIILDQEIYLDEKWVYQNLRKKDKVL